jgi:hypothetical protein
MYSSRIGTECFGDLFLGLPEKDLRGLICRGDTPCRTMGEKTKSREEYSSFFDSGIWKSFLEQELVRRFQSCFLYAHNVVLQIEADSYKIQLQEFNA